MYYSKNISPSIAVPKNYSGNTFRVIDESERRYIKNEPEADSESTENFSADNEEKIEANDTKATSSTSIFSDISLEDLLLLGLILIIHKENPNDSTLILLLVLLLAK